MRRKQRPFSMREINLTTQASATAERQGSLIGQLDSERSLLPRKKALNKQRTFKCQLCFKHAEKYLRDVVLSAMPKKAL